SSDGARSVGRALRHVAEPVAGRPARRWAHPLFTCEPRAQARDAFRGDCAHPTRLFLAGLDSVGNLDAGDWLSPSAAARPARTARRKTQSVGTDRPSDFHVEFYARADYFAWALVESAMSGQLR